MFQDQKYEALKTKYEKLKKSIATVAMDFSVDAIKMDMLGDRKEDYLAHNMKTGAASLSRLLLERGYIELKDFPLSDAEQYGLRQYRMILTVVKPDDTGESFADQLVAAKAEGRAEGIRQAGAWLQEQLHYCSGERDSAYWGRKVAGLK